MNRKALRRVARDAVVRLARTIGMQIRDPASGETLGRAFVIPWRGKLHIVGLDRPVRAVFLPQKRLTYWKQELGFTTHPPLDFPNEGSSARASETRKDRSSGPSDQR